MANTFFSFGINFGPFVFIHIRMRGPHLRKFNSLVDKGYPLVYFDRLHLSFHSTC